jgi:ribosomal protein S18 acetylase RimI-like enzyme
MPPSKAKISKAEPSKPESAPPDAVSATATDDVGALEAASELAAQPVVKVRRLHRRDLNQTWEFLKLVFRAVNRETVEFQRPTTKKRFQERYEESGVEQLVFVTQVEGKEMIVGYAECAEDIIGADSWMNERYFRNREMRPLYVEELAVHPAYQGRGLGSFVMDQLEHLARVRGCSHLVLEVAENNERALQFYKARNFTKLDAAIFMAKKVVNEAEILPPRPLSPPRK